MGAFEDNLPREADRVDAWFAQDIDGDERADRIFATLAFLDSEQSHRTELNMHHLRLYSRRMFSGLTGRGYDVLETAGRIRLNVVRAVIDAAAAQISAKKTKPFFLTSGGTRKDRKKALNLTRYTAGQFYETRAYLKMQQAFVDACIFGTGFIKVSQDDGRICLERIFPDEIVVDESDARDGYPRTLYHHMEAHKDVLCALYPDHADHIMAAEVSRYDSGMYRTPTSGKCSVVEAWHLPSRPGAKDGMRAIVINGTELESGPWERDGFPFAVFRWQDSPLGYFGTGIGEETSSMQEEINFVAQKIQESANQVSTKFAVAAGEGVASQAINNEIGGTVHYRNRPPQVLNPAPIHPLFIEWLEKLYNRAFEITGVSRAHAQGEIPAGLNSGKAIRMHDRIQSKRFRHVEQRYEQFALDITDLLLDCAREIEESGDGESLKVLAQDDDGVMELKFSDVSIDKNKYVMRVYPTNYLQDQPEAKVQGITELSQADETMGKFAIGALTGVPDLEAYARTANAPLDLILGHIDAMLDGLPQTPKPYMNLKLAIELVGKAVCQAESEKEDPEVINIMTNYLEQAVEMEKMQAPQAAAPAPQAMAPVPQAAAAPGMEMM